MSLCVNINSKEFKDTAKRLNISDGSLEVIVHEFMNTEGNANAFPSDSYILSKVKGQPFTESLSEKAQRLIDIKYSKPITVNSYADAQAVMNDMAQYFDPKHIGLKETADNRYEVSLNSEVIESVNKEEVKENKQSVGLLNLLDEIAAHEKINNYSRRGELLSKFKDRYYIPKGTTLESIEQYRIKDLLPKGIFSINEHTREVIINEEVLEDAISRNEKNVGFENLFINAEEGQQVQKVLDFLSAKTGLKYQTISEDEAKKLLKKRDVTSTNAFVSKDTVYFIKGRQLNTDIAAEEMLHPFVASIRLDNAAAFNSLLINAKRAFPKLRLEIMKSYDKESVNEELVTQALSRAFRQDYEENPNHNSVLKLLQTFWNYVKGWFRNIGDSPIFSKDDKIFAQDLSETITIQNLAKIINTEINLGNADNIDRVAFNKEETAFEQFQNRTARVSSQLNTLLNSNLMSNTEVRHVAEQAAYYISDSITEFLEDPSKVFKVFPELATKNGNPMTKEEKAAEAKKIKKLSRVEFARYITANKLVDLAKTKLFNPQENTTIDDLTLMDKAELISNNFDAIMEFANDAFTVVEDFSLTSTKDEFSVQKTETSTDEDFENDNDSDRTAEEEGDIQEHWQIESRTRDVMSSMSQLVKRVLNQCFQTKIEDGKEVPIRSEFGIKERIKAKDATASILRWTRGAESLSHMVQMLEAKSEENPWIKQVINKLKDTSGNESDFQSQFYGVFAKAFQPYSIVLKEKNTKTNEYEYRSIPVNQHPALTEAKQSIEVAFKTNTHPMFNNGEIRKDVLDTFTAITNSLIEKTQNKLEENSKPELIDLFVKAAAALGYVTDENTVNLALDNTQTFHTLVNKLKSISENLNAAIGEENYDPFKFRGKNSISGYLSDFLAPITEKLEETAVSSFYDSGKMYQSYVTPSYLTVLMNRFTSDDARFQEFLQHEYGNYSWFKNEDGSWRNKWLEILDQLPQEERKDLFKHKVQLNFNKHNYMRNMSDVEYALSILSEYFSETAGAKGTTVPVWYRIPMMSNKPSSEFIRMYAYTGSSMRYILTEGFNRIFQQELSRIQTVEIRDYDKKNPNFIKSFDKNGRKFMMLDFFNKYLKDGKEQHSELGRLINKAIEQGTEKLTVEELSQMNKLVNQEIVTSLDNKAEAIIREWRNSGIFEGVKQIAGVGKEDSVIQDKLTEFIWNDTFASMNILELTITDPAFYKDAEDLQKRLAQIHAPGIRANVEATDYEGNRVTDGKFRTALLTDFDDFISNIKDNLRIVFDRKLKELENSGVSTEDSKYKVTVAIYDNIIEQFNHINVADAQGYSSPTSYRKKAFIFGKWSKSAEEIYQRLKNGNYNYSDLETAFQPLKPFVYGQIEKPSINSERSDIATPLNKLKVPVQFKNSEYLLIMADAILQGEDTGKPNLLRAIYEVMEESAEGENKIRGIDTIQFESTCKSGLMGAINIKQFYNVENGEALAKAALEKAIYNSDKTYNSTHVYEVPFENYAIQQEVPEHFKDHAQAHGSQIRYIIPSDLESVDSEGNPITYNYFDRGVEKKLNAEEFKEEYENNISQNIEASIDDLSKELGLDNAYFNRKDRNIALSKILLEEIYSSPRYGVELAIACTVNPETGEFNIPLGDPIQSKRIEQLINSVVKNRINKQEIAGGPVVQVTNFGTSRELNIRFKDKNGGLLMTRKEFEASNEEDSYENYIKNNQASIAYYEVFAPIFANELFEKFADKNGNIDIETIEKINPDLLKMIGYRIPTEDKYSMAPLKIVGFLPREAGDGIMLPNDITLLTGSDFDVDKFYLMRKEIDITKRYLGNPISITGTEDNVTEHRASLRKELFRRYTNKYNLDSKQSREDIFKNINILLEDPFTSVQNETQQRLKDIYVDYMFDYIEPSEGTQYRNNKIVDMSWAVLTNETTASKMLIPGGFEPQKRMGYLISAYQNPAVNMTWEQLNAIEDIDELKSLCYTDKNLCFIDTHLQFYKQNSAAATALGMAAVQKVAHAVLESNGFNIDVTEALDFHEDEYFSIAGKRFSDRMEIDSKYNDEGALIGRTLGEFVAMFADAVKDPVANLMNINNTTMPIVTTLIRFGMPFEKAALFISQPAIRRVLESYNAKNVTNFVRLSDVIESQIKDIENQFEVEDNSRLKELNEITEEELINGLRDGSAVTNYKVLKFFQYLDTLSKQLKSPTYATRFNSISNAVGPLVIDNLIKEYKADSGKFDYFYDREGNHADFNTILMAHPILNSFYKTLSISANLLDEMPANSSNFRNMLNSANDDVKYTLYGDKKTLSELSDFYQSYLLIASGAIPVKATEENKHQGLKYYIEQFPADFMRGKAKELFKGNALIDAIKVDVQKGRTVLKVDTVGLTTQDKEHLSDGWVDLYRSNDRGRALAQHLFYYNFWRTGIGFSPKSFMGLFPARLRSEIPGYNESFTVVNSGKFAENVNGKSVLEQFVRNNADNNKLVPRVKFGGKEGLNPQRNDNTYMFSDSDYEAIRNKYYIKVKIGNRDVLLQRIANDEVDRQAIYTELSLLGNNNEYFEAFLGSDYVPLAQTSEVKQQNNEGQVREVTNNQMQVDDVPIEDTHSISTESKRSTKIKDMLLKMFTMSGRTEEQAKSKMEEFKNKSTKEKNSIKPQMKKFIANKFDQLGIKYNEELLEEMYNELC